MNKFIKKYPLAILAAALVLVVGSTVGSTRAAITSTSDAFLLDFETTNLDVELLENGSSVSDGNLAFPELKSEDGSVSLTYGKTYNESLSVKNTGDYEAYVRVIVTKSWIDNESRAKDTMLNPSYIDLGNVSEDWIIAGETEEQTVYYSKRPVAIDAELALTNTLTVKNDVTYVTKSNVTENTIKTTYDYQGKSFDIDVKVEAVQTRHAADAMLGAWGVNATFTDDTEAELVSVQ